MMQNPRDEQQAKRTILIGGASGLVGHAVKEYFSEKGFTIKTLVRRPPKNVDEISWDPAKGEVELAKLEGIDFVIHLSGETIAQRWTASAKKRIILSRVDTTRFLVQTLKKLSTKPKQFLCASATGYYGFVAGGPHDEHASLGQGFLASVCKDWESEARNAVDAGIAVTHLRFGVVIAPKGGMLQKILPIFKLGLGGPVGGGAQLFSWIAIDDLTRAIHHCMVKSVTGPVNCTSPYAETNRSFTKKLARELQRPAFFPVPAFAVKLLFGEMADETVLADTNAVPGRLLETGFTFQYPHFEDYLAKIL